MSDLERVEDYSAAELAAEVRQLRAETGELRAQFGGLGRVRRVRRRLLLGALAVAALVGGLLVNASFAQAGTVSIPPQTIANHISVAGQGLVQLVVSGGSTTVPTDATRVTFAVTINDATANGNVAANPTGAASSGTLIRYFAGSNAKGTLTEQVGRSNQVAFHNGGADAITLSVQITGYSTDVRAGDLSPTGGSSGQVLTNTGGGVAWQDIPLSDGATVLNGSGAPADSLGSNGDFYIDTTANAIYGPKAGGSWPASGTSLVGPKGDPGSDGKTVLNGSGAPDDSLGANGDFYLDTTANAIYGPKAGGSWPTSGTSLVGPKGDAGPQGDAGPAGPGSTVISMRIASGDAFDMRDIPNSDLSADWSCSAGEPVFDGITVSEANFNLYAANTPGLQLSGVNTSTGNSDIEAGASTSTQPFYPQLNFVKNGVVAFDAGYDTNASDAQIEISTEPAQGDAGATYSHLTLVHGSVGATVDLYLQADNTGTPSCSIQAIITPTSQ